MIIPHNEIARDTLLNLIKEFVLREGTDYGADEVSIDTKVEQVHSQLVHGKLVITYSEEYETIDICTADKFSQA